MLAKDSNLAKNLGWLFGERKVDFDLEAFFQKHCSTELMRLLVEATRKGGFSLDLIIKYAPPEFEDVSFGEIVSFFEECTREYKFRQLPWMKVRGLGGGAKKATRKTTKKKGGRKKMTNKEKVIKRFGGDEEYAKQELIKLVKSKNTLTEVVEELGIPTIHDRNIWIFLNQQMKINTREIVGKTAK